MSFLDVDFKEATDIDFGLVKPGEYEVVAVKYDTTPAGTGTARTNFQFKIREDINQPHKNKILFHDFYHTPKTKGIVIGFLKELDEDADGIQFQNQKEFAEFVLMKPIRAKVAIEEYTKRDGSKGERNKISFFKKSEYPMIAPTGEEESQPEAEGVDLSEDDFPF